MATTITKQHPHLTARDDAITRWEAAEADLRKAQRAEREAPKPSAARLAAREQRLSAGARKSNARRAISEAEYDLRLEGIEHTAWVEPEPPADLGGGRRGKLPKTQAELQASLDKIRALQATLKKGQDDSVIHTGELRIAAIIRAAEDRGYKLS